MEKKIILILVLGVSQNTFSFAKEKNKEFFEEVERL
jgi:hypothetical protein